MFRDSLNLVEHFLKKIAVKKKYGPFFNFDDFDCHIALVLSKEIPKKPLLCWRTYTKHVFDKFTT